MPTWAGTHANDLPTWTNHLKRSHWSPPQSIPPCIKFAHTTDEMFGFAGLLLLQDRVHANRLRFLARIIRACPPITWTLVNAHTAVGSWHQLCLQSCAWFLQHFDRPLSVGPDATLAEWIQHIALDVRWKGRIRKATKLALAYHRANAEHIIWQRHASCHRPDSAPILFSITM